VRRNAVLRQLLPLSMLKAEGCNFRDLLRTANFRKSGGYCSWLRHYATSRKVAGSIPDEVIGFFN
jgi:hypothetical protein